jgi:hypothetical protein
MDSIEEAEDQGFGVIRNRFGWAQDFGETSASSVERSVEVEAKLSLAPPRWSGAVRHVTYGTHGTRVSQVRVRLRGRVREIGDLLAIGLLAIGYARSAPAMRVAPAMRAAPVMREARAPSVARKGLHFSTIASSYLHR